MTKRILSMLCAALLLALAVIPAAAMADSTAYVKTQSGCALRIRSSATTDADNVVGKIAYGTKVTVKSKKGDWSHISVKLNGKTVTGYVYSRYLSSKKPTAVSSTSTNESTSTASTSYSGFKQVASYSVVVRPATAGGFVNLRWAPSKTAPVMDRLHDGDKLTVIAQNSTWAQVMNVSNGEVGYIMRRFLEGVI